MTSESYPHRFLFVDYDKLHDNTDDELLKIAEFLELVHPIPAPEIRTTSKDKWKKNLTIEQKNNINNTLKNNNLEEFII